MYNWTNRPLRVALIACTLVLAWSEAALAIDEATFGDISSLPASPTSVGVLTVGNNQLKGGPAFDPWMIWLTWLLVGTVGAFSLSRRARRFDATPAG